MYMRAVGWDVGRKDKIDLDGPSLKEKQGLYACPPLRDTDRPFHCALEVHEELIKVIPLAQLSWLQHVQALCPLNTDDCRTLAKNLCPGSGHMLLPVWLLLGCSVPAGMSIEGQYMHRLWHVKSGPALARDAALCLCKRMSQSF